MLFYYHWHGFIISATHLFVCFDYQHIVQLSIFSSCYYCKKCSSIHYHTLWNRCCINAALKTWIVHCIHTIKYIYIRSINQIIQSYLIYKCDCLCENRPYWHNNWNPIYSLTLKLHSCTVQAHQAHWYR